MEYTAVSKPLTVIQNSSIKFLEMEGLLILFGAFLLSPL